MSAKRSLLVPAALVSACSGLWAPPVQDEDGLRLGGSRLVGNTSRRVKTMTVQGHTVSEVSERWTGKVVYAIFTSAIPKYHEALVAEMETWAARPASEGRYVAVGGSNYPAEWQGKNVLRSECGDNMESISCKEATLLAEGAARGADWLYVIGEDNYVHTRRMEQFLSTKDPDAAVAYGVTGCGKGTFCTDNKAYNEKGGICGGSGYIISRAALQNLLAEGAPALHATYDRTPWPNDMTTSCQLRKHGAELVYADNMFGYPMAGIEEYEDYARGGTFLTVHYVMPSTMRWFHALNEGAAEPVVQRLREEAFHNGCDRNMELRLPQRYAECLQAHNAEATWN